MKICLEEAPLFNEILMNGDSTLVSYGVKATLENLKSQALPYSEQVAFLHPKKHYLSQEKLDFFIKNISQSADLSAEADEKVINFLVKSIIWGNQTKTGLIHEINLNREEWVFFDFVSGEGKFWENAIKKAKNAKIIIVPHHFLIDEEMKKLELKNIFIKDALLLEDHITHAFTKRFSSFRSNAGFKFLRAFEGVILQGVTLQESGLQILFGVFGMYFQKNTDILKTNNVIIDEYFKNTIEGKKIFETIKKFHENLMNQDLVIHENLMNWKKEVNEFFMLFLEEKYLKNLTWISVYNDSIEVTSAPVSISESLKNLWERSENIAVSDIALSLNSDFSFLKRNLGIPESFETKKTISSALQTIEFEIPENIPEPNSEGYFRKTLEIIEDTINFYKENLAVIFHSRKGLEAIYENLLPKFSKIELLAEGKTGSLPKIIELYSKSPASKILFTTNAISNYLEKIAPHIKCIIFQKLPFEFGFNPLVSARVKQYPEYLLLKALLRFKHFLLTWDNMPGKKKLILLDPRLLRRAYGKNFLSELGYNKIA